MSYEQEHEHIKVATNDIWEATERLRAALSSVPLFSTTIGEYLSLRSAVKNANSVLVLLERDMGVNK